MGNTNTLLLKYENKELWQNKDNTFDWIVKIPTNTTNNNNYNQTKIKVKVKISHGYDNTTSNSYQQNIFPIVYYNTDEKKYDIANYLHTNARLNYIFKLSNYTSFYDTVEVNSNEITRYEISSENQHNGFNLVIYKLTGKY